MQLAAGLFAALFGGGGAAAGAGAAAAGAGAAAATSGSLLSLGSIGTVFSAVAGIGSGLAALGQAEANSQQQQFEATNEYIQGKQASANLRLQLANTISDQAVAFAAGGADLGSVSVQQAKRQATTDAERQLSLNADTSLTRALQRRRMAAMTLSQGAAQMFSSTANAFSTLAGSRLQTAQIG